MPREGALAISDLEFCFYFYTVIFETVHEPQFEEVLFVQHIYAFFSCRVIDFTCADVAVKHGISKSELILVTHA